MNNKKIARGYTKNMWNPKCQSAKDASSVDMCDIFSIISEGDASFSTSLSSCLKNNTTTSPISENYNLKVNPEYQYKIINKLSSQKLYRISYPITRWTDDIIK